MNNITTKKKKKSESSAEFDTVKRGACVSLHSAGERLLSDPNSGTNSSPLTSACSISPGTSTVNGRSKV